MPLTALAPRNAAPRAKPYKLTDGQGLYLLVKPNGSRLWRLAYRFGGAQKTLAIGAFPDVGLAEAREARFEARRKLAAGIDPSAEKKKERLAAQVAAANSFGVLAEEWLEKRKKEGLADQTMYRDRHILVTYAEPLWHRPVADIKPSEILAEIRTMEKRGAYDLAHRFRSLVSRVFRYAIATERADNDPAAALDGALVAHQVKHHPGLTDPLKVGGLMRAIEGYDGHPSTRLGLRFLAHAFPRTIEMRFAEKAEFDLPGAVWRIPGRKMKMKRDHIVPLSRQSVAIVTEMLGMGMRGPYLFPAARNIHSTMSDNTINGALRRLGYSGDVHVGHGFRTTASTTLNESGLFHEDWIERQLAHVEGNKVRRAYNAALHLPERTRMMQWYSDWLDGQRDLSALLHG